MAKELFRPARELQDQGRLNEAIVALRHALRVDGSKGRAWCCLGYLLQERGDLEEAVQCFRKGIELRPFDEIAAGSLVFALRASGLHKAARIEALRFLVLVDETRVRIGADMHDDFEGILEEGSLAS